MINTASATFTRPANTTNYAAGDEMSNSTTAGEALPLIFRNLTDTMYGTGKILKAKLSSNVQGINKELRLLIYREAPVMFGDNNPHQMNNANTANLIGFFDFSTDYFSPTGSTNSVSMTNGISIPIVSKDKNGGNPIYGVLVADGSLSPSSGQSFTIELFCEPRTTVN
jgi:hypothetical protein